MSLLNEESFLMEEEDGGAGYTAKSVIIDAADNYLSGTFIGLRSVDFWFEGSKITVSASEGSGGETSKLSADYGAEFVFYTALLKTGAQATRGWLTSAATTNQRLFFTFNSPITFDSIIINNSHNNGVLTNSGIDNVKIYTTEDLGAISTVYGSVITDSVLIYDDVFRMHVALDQADPETLVLIP